MSVPSVEGERDATIIAFPLQRVAPPHTSDSCAAVVIPLLGLVTEEKTVSSPEPTDPQRRRAHNVAVHALAGRGQSREEMERKLLSRELPEEAVADEIERLEGLGLINDVDLASDLLDRYAQRQGLGRHAVAQKMRERRLAPEVIAHALSAVSDADERGRLLEVARDRARALRSLAPDVAKRRLAAYLQRRGFRGNDIFSVIDEVLAES